MDKGDILTIEIKFEEMDIPLRDLLIKTLSDYSEDKIPIDMDIFSKMNYKIEPLDISTDIPRPRDLMNPTIEELKKPMTVLLKLKAVKTA